MYLFKEFFVIKNFLEIEIYFRLDDNWKRPLEDFYESNYYSWTLRHRP